MQYMYIYVIYIYNIPIYIYIYIKKYRFELTFQSCTVKNFTSSLGQRVKTFCML